jgi:hypothetical protein
MSRLFLLAILLIWAIAFIRLIAEGEWYLVASLAAGIILARHDIRRIFREGEEEK